MLSVLFAQDQPATPQASPFGNMMFLLLGLMLVFWLVVILPMSRRQRKEQEKVLASISRGARIVTDSGIVGTVVTANPGEDEVVIRSEDTKLRIKRHKITQVLGTEPNETASK